MDAIPRTSSGGSFPLLRKSCRSDRARPHCCGRHVCSLRETPDAAAICSHSKAAGGGAALCRRLDRAGKRRGPELITSHPGGTLGAAAAASDVRLSGAPGRRRTVPARDHEPWRLAQPDRSQLLSARGIPRRRQMVCQARLSRGGAGRHRLWRSRHRHSRARPLWPVLLEGRQVHQSQFPRRRTCRCASSISGSSTI